MRTLVVNKATGGHRVSVVAVYQSPGSRPAEDRELFLFLRVVAGLVCEILIPWDFNAPEVV